MTEEARVKVHHFFLIKHVIQEDGALIAVGTFIQHCFVDEAIKENIKGSETTEIKFGYRFNDLTADKDNGWIRHRRTEKSETDMGTLYRHTYQVKAPLEVTVEKDYFPFRVVSAKLLVELNTFTTPDNETRLRPNIILFLGDKTNMFSIQKDSMSDVKGLTAFQMAKDKMDQADSYDFISPFPKVAYLYDTKKRYCPKFQLTFLMVEDGMKKFVEIVAPMILIACMNTIHVLNSDEQVDTADYIANSATFALSVFFFLPTLFGSSRIHKIWSPTNLYIIFIFVALALSSIPDTWAGHKLYAIAGMIIYWVSFLFPVVNGIRYLHYRQKKKRIANPADFWPGKNKITFKASKNISHEFAKVGDIVFKPANEREKLGYSLREVHKFQILEFASKEGK